MANMGGENPHIYYNNYLWHHFEEADVIFKLFHLIFNISILCIITSGLRQFLCETISLSLPTSLSGLLAELPESQTISASSLIPVQPKSHYLSVFKFSPLVDCAAVIFPFSNPF